MINFLPPEAKTLVKREYRTRLASVWGLLLGGIGAVGAGLLAPTYVLLVNQLDALASPVVGTQDQSKVEAYKTSREDLAKTQALATQLAVPRRHPAASDVLRQVQDAESSGIAILGFTYEYTDTEVTALEVNGVAATREALAQFSAALERDPLFLHADVPVSSLATERNLPFTITITLAEKI
jgi:hypothetical protein